jgi:hypothetical protein
VASFLLAWALSSTGKPFPAAVNDRGPLRHVGREGGREGGKGRKKEGGKEEKENTWTLDQKPTIQVSLSPLAILPPSSLPPTFPPSLSP